MTNAADTIAQNITFWSAFVYVLTDNDEKVEKHNQFKTRMQNPHPI